MYLAFFLILLPKYFAKVHALSRASPPSGGAAGRPLCTAGSLPTAPGTGGPSPPDCRSHGRAVPQGVHHADTVHAHIAIAAAAMAIRLPASGWLGAPRLRGCGAHWLP
jgi:hypothetical protein